MDNTVVVTVTTRSWTFRYDMELPTGQMVVALKRDIIEALNAYDPHLGLGGEVRLVNLRTNQPLPDYATLDMAEVWNGDYIAIEPAY